MGAVLFDKKKRVLAVENNSYKTHPLVLQFAQYPTLHAEMNCLVHYGLDNCEGCGIMIVRIRKDNSLGMARPCPACEAALHYAKVKDVYYTTDEGQLQCQSLT